MFGYPLPIPLEALAIKLISGYSPQLVIVGDETGIGKSMLGCRSAELIYYRAFGKIWKPIIYDENKKILEQNLFFRMSKFKGELFRTSKRILIIEEAEIELGSDNWASIQNKYFARMKSTQRIKGNLYIIILPIFMQLAKKHRRAVNYIFDVKSRGFFQAYKLLKKASQVTGDELSKFYLGGCTYNLPNCKEDFDKLDKENKDRIEIEEGENLEYQIALKQAKKDKLKYRFSCPYCKFAWENYQIPTKTLNKSCPSCKKFIYHKQDETFKVFRVLT